MSDTSSPSERLSRLAARDEGLSHLIDHSPPTLADDLRLAETRGREAARETLRAEGAAATRERIRPVLARLSAWVRDHEEHDPPCPQLRRFHSTEEYQAAVALGESFACTCGWEALRRDPDVSAAVAWLEGERAAERERIRLELEAELARLYEEVGPPPGKGIGNARDGFVEALQVMELFARRLEPRP